MVSFIIPVYNAEKYIAEALNSILLQTISDWEIIIVNDCSTDSTKDVVASFCTKDSRIKLISTPEASGSAIYPRWLGIKEASGSLIAPLDADDFVGPEYLANLLTRREKTGADIVYPTMYGSNTEYTIPISEVDKDLLKGSLPGKDCVHLTLNGWNIHCNGGVIPKNLYLKAYAEIPEGMRHANADELLTRKLLFLTPKVAMTRDKYYYRMHPGQSEKSSAARAFTYMITDRELLKFTNEKFGVESEEFKLAQLQAFYGIFAAWSRLVAEKYTREARAYAKQQIRQTQNMLDMNIITPVGNKRYVAMYRMPGFVRNILLYLIAMRRRK